MIEVAAFYRFAPLRDPEGAARALRRALAEAGVLGSVLLAREGVNGTLAGAPTALDTALGAVRGLPGCAEMGARRGPAAAPPFRRLKVRAKPEIVTLGAGDLGVAGRTGRKVAPEDWAAVLDDPAIPVIDTRNAYETAIGGFPGAVDPGTACFRDFPGWWEARGRRLGARRVAMYCTGGIRCEKASAWLLRQGVEEVLQLEGGVLAYLERVPEAESRWRGECFVFDGRVAVGPGLAEGSHALCHACGRAVSPADRASPDWREGVSCPACIQDYAAADRARFAERERQVRLAEARGRAHLGAAAAPGRGSTGPGAGR